MRKHVVTVLRPGLRAPAFFCLIAIAGPAMAQTPPRAAPSAAQQAPAARPAVPAATARRIVAPDQIGALKILGSTILAVDHADKTGNYSVLLGLGSAGFQSSNSAVSLGAVFSIFRQQRIDLSDVLILSPSYEIAPAMIGPDTFRMRGRYALPRGVLAFDLMYRWDNGWRLDAISLLPPAPPAVAPPRPTVAPAPRG